MVRAPAGVYLRRVNRRPTSLLLATVLSLGLVAPAATVQAEQVAPPVVGASGIGDPYWPLDGNGGIDVASYRIDNTYRLRTGRLKGRTTITLTATEDLSRFSLDFLLGVRSVTVDGRPAAHDQSRDPHELDITPAAPLARGSVHSVVVTYSDVPERHRYAGEMNWLSNRNEVVAMNEPHMAPWWFPSNDHPTDKALVDISVTVPRGNQVVANGKLVKRTTRRKTTTWRWRADEPMATYLAFFAAGRFDVRSGTTSDLPWVVAVSERLGPQTRRKAMRLVRSSAAVAKGLEKDLGPYPFSTTGGLVTALNSGFALENQTRPTYGAWISKDVVVHEIAHQWFGNHVAVSRWRDIWMNEGFASFMEWRWTETHGGPTAARQLSTFYDAIPASSDFWQLHIGDPGSPRVFDWAVYQRGAMTLQALRNRIGDQAFWRLLRTWLQRKGGGNGSSAEFEALAEEVSGVDLDAFFTTWLRTSARPARTPENGLG